MKYSLIATRNLLLLLLLLLKPCSIANCTIIIEPAMTCKWPRIIIGIHNHCGMHLVYPIMCGCTIIALIHSLLILLHGQIRQHCLVHMQYKYNITCMTYTSSYCTVLIILCFFEV